MPNKAIYQVKNPILLIVFNRPEETKAVFERIRAVKPQVLYVAADGPRQSRDSDLNLTKETRKIFSKIDWHCELKTRFLDENLGCKYAVSSAIDWFFEQEEQGIIIEDDVLPEISFFKYCDFMIEKYKFNKNIGIISGCNLVYKKIKVNKDYYFSRYGHIWGWATWRRVWKLYKVDLLIDKNALNKIKRNAGLGLVEMYNWENIFHEVAEGKINTWDYQLQYCLWLNGYLAVLPKVNQTKNLGFGEAATHTKNDVPDYVLESPAQYDGDELCMREDTKRDKFLDRLIGKYVYKISVINTLKVYFYKIKKLRILVQKIKKYHQGKA